MCVTSAWEVGNDDPISIRLLIISFIAAIFLSIFLSTRTRKSRDTLISTRTIISYDTGRFCSEEDAWDEVTVVCNRCGKRETFKSDVDWPTSWGSCVCCNKWECYDCLDIGYRCCESLRIRWEEEQWARQSHLQKSRNSSLLSLSSAGSESFEQHEWLTSTWWY